MCTHLTMADYVSECLTDRRDDYEAFRLRLLTFACAMCPWHGEWYAVGTFSWVLVSLKHSLSVSARRLFADTIYNAYVVNSCWIKEMKLASLWQNANDSVWSKTKNISSWNIAKSLGLTTQHVNSYRTSFR